ncbi:MAG: PepSY domain-containing protein [Acidimicrobiia bacterium]
MSENTRLKKRLYTGVVALGLAIGSVGIAAAASNGSADAPAPADTAISDATAPIVLTDTETDDAAVSADNGTEVHEAPLTGSIQAPAEDDSLSEADETAQLESLATISADEAAAAATSAVPGDVDKVELDNENGAVVYSVEITDTAGGQTEVTVDAGDGAVLSQQADHGDDEGRDEANEVDDDGENGNEKEAQHGNEVDDD